MDGEFVVFINERPFGPAMASIEPGDRLRFNAKAIGNILIVILSCQQGAVFNGNLPDNFCGIEEIPHKTNEIYQVGYQKINDSKKANNVTAIEDDLVGELQNIKIFPNPVLTDFHFVLDDNYVLSRDDYYWKLIDQRGMTMLEGNLLFRNSRITVSTDEIPSGMYHLVMGVEGKPMLYRKIAIMHR